jgi:hypothetical protein
MATGRWASNEAPTSRPQIQHLAVAIRDKATCMSTIFVDLSVHVKVKVKVSLLSRFHSSTDIVSSSNEQRPLLSKLHLAPPLSSVCLQSSLSLLHISLKELGHKLVYT